MRGAELSPVTAAFAREHFALDVTAGSWRDAGIAEGSLDVVTLFDVIEHMPDLLNEPRGIRRMLKPGGLLLQSTLNIDGLFPKVSQPFADLLDYWPHPEPPHHLYQFSVRTLSELDRQGRVRARRVDQTRIGLDYSFGTPKHWRVSKKLCSTHWRSRRSPLSACGSGAATGSTRGTRPAPLIGRKVPRSIRPSHRKPAVVTSCAGKGSPT